MSTPGAKVGPLTVADLQAIWQGSTDSSYWQPFVAAGEGAGFEAWTQMFVQFARAATAADVSLQAMYILPWSGQSNPPASGGNYATVQLTVARSSQYMQWALYLQVGTLVGEQTTDASSNGPVAVQTGRQYQLLQPVVFAPGDAGPYTVTAQAVNWGYGYNNPLGQWQDAWGNVRPGTISAISQPGTQYFHDRASVVVTPTGAPVAPAQPPLQPGRAANAQLVTVNEADTLIPQHVGQYVLMTAGMNQGKVGRVKAYTPPNTSVTPNTGGTGQLAYEESVQFSPTSGPGFQAGETVNFTTGGTTLVATGAVLGVGGGGTSLVFELQTGTVATGDAVTGVSSGTVGAVTFLQQTNTWTAEAPPTPAPPLSGCNWQVLDWVSDLGVTVQNVLQPTGGTSAILDGLGLERNIPRGNGETDGPYRARVAAVSDVVSPNAIRRALTKALGTAPWCFREVGTSALPGFFYDRVGDPNGDFYDANVLLFTTASSSLVITSIAVTAGGTYSSAPAVNFSGGGGAGATATAVLDGIGRVVRVVITATGSGYTSAPTVSFTGGGGSGAVAVATVGINLIVNEPIWWEDSSGRIVAEGWWGGQVPGTNNLIFILHTWRTPARTTVAAGDQIVGQLSGHVYVPSGVSQPATTNGWRWKTYFDYASFRGYFLVGVNPTGAGECGFFYDTYPLSHLGGFYDDSLATFPNFYDGYPTGYASSNKRVQTNVEAARAGGVNWDLYQERIGCP